MEKTDSIRERLLSQLPQTENVAAYKEEVAVLLAKHKKALAWEGTEINLMRFLVLVLFLLGLWARTKGLAAADGLFTLVAMCFLGMVVGGARNQLSKSQFGLLKEIKQLQVQMLELQASLHRTKIE